MQNGNKNKREILDSHPIHDDHWVLVHKGTNMRVACYDWLLLQLAPWTPKKSPRTLQDLANNWIIWSKLRIPRPPPTMVWSPIWRRALLGALGCASGARTRTWEFQNHWNPDWKCGGFFNYISFILKIYQTTMFITNTVFVQRNTSNCVCVCFCRAQLSTWKPAKHNRR